MKHLAFPGIKSSLLASKAPMLRTPAYQPVCGRSAIGSLDVSGAPPTRGQVMLYGMLWGGGFGGAHSLPPVCLAPGRYPTKGCIPLPEGAVSPTCTMNLYILSDGPGVNTSGNSEFSINFYF